MKNRHLILPFLLLSTQAFAFEVSADKINDVTKLLSLDTVGPQVDCFDPQTTPSCTEITKRFCSDLSQNQGHMKNSTGAFNVGPSAKSKLSSMDIDDLRNLSNSLPRLPRDMQKKLKKHLEELKKAVAAEADSTEWYTRINIIKSDIFTAIDDLAVTRGRDSLKKKIPQGSKATDADILGEKTFQFNDMIDSITKAKVEVSPNWPRIQGIFTKVKTDMLKVINDSPFSPADKAARIAKINETNLGMPIGLKVGGTLGDILNQDCRSNMMNALYMDSTKSLTVCMGMINGYTSEASLYFILSHELAHSFNQALLSKTAASTSPAAKIRARIIEGNGQLSCEEYQKLDQTDTGPEVSYCATGPYDNFLGCLTKGRLPPKNSADEGKGFIKRMDYCAMEDQSTGLAYMNPTVHFNRNFENAANSPFSPQGYEGNAIPGRLETGILGFIIAQEIKCRPGAKCKDLLNSILSAPAPAEPQGLAPDCETKAEMASENEADWFARKAVAIDLSRISDVREKREFAASSMAYFCDFKYYNMTADQKASAMELIAEMQEHAPEDNHGDDDERLEAIMIPEIATQLQCTLPPEDDNSFSPKSCKL